MREEPARLDERLRTDADALAVRFGMRRVQVTAALFRMFLVRCGVRNGIAVRIAGDRTGYRVVDVEENDSLETVLAASNGADDVADVREPRYALATRTLAASARDRRESVVTVSDDDAWDVRLVPASDGTRPAGLAFDAGTFAAFARAALADPRCPCDAVPLAAGEHAETLLAAGDGGERFYDEAATLDRAIARRALAEPDAVAVRCGDDRTATYRELLRQAAGVSRVLRERGVAPGARVVVTADMSERCVAAILGIWSVGAVYVPVDPSLPLLRARTIATDAEAVLSFVDARYRDLVCTDAVVDLADVAACDDAFDSIARPDGEAFIVYTSGSTGAPKGVPVRHDATRNAVFAANERNEITAADRTLHRTAIAFDLSVYDIFTTLAAGATLILASSAAFGDSVHLIAEIVAHRATRVLTTPTLLEFLVAEPSFAGCTTLRTVTCGGEALSFALCRRFFASSHAVLFNLYGPSETTMLVTLHRCDPSDERSGEASAPLGRPLRNTHVSLRDAALRPVPAGIVGEIVVGGMQVSDGYVNRPLETESRFVADPMRPGERLYRTGDVGRVHRDGSLTFLRRNDRQVKIRGIRIEPEEAAVACERVAGVRSAVVVTKRRSADDGETILAAYVMIADGSPLDARALRAELALAVPSHMVPSEITIVSDYPRTVTGKIDRVRMRGDDYAASLRDATLASVADAFPTERLQRIYAVWSDLLKTNDIRIDDDFFSIGGDSLLAMHLMNRLEEHFGHRFALRDFIETMTIASIDAVLATGAERVDNNEVVLNRTGSLPPLIYLHGDLYGGLYSRKIGLLFGRDQPIAVIAPHGVPGRPPLTHVESMGEELAATVARLFPDGPLRIAAYSFSSLVAYDAARRLRAQGRDVLDVIAIGVPAESLSFRLVDRVLRRFNATHAVRDAVLIALMNLWYPLERFARSPWRERVEKLRNRFSKARRWKPPIGDTIGNAERDSLYLRYVRAHKTYVPQPYDGNMTLVWPDAQPVENGELLADWRRAAPAIRIVSTPGTHHGAVTHHFPELVAVMQRNFS